MEILALLLKKNKSIKPYRTKFGLEHFIDMYADDLSVYLEFKRKSKFENKQNVRNVLQTLDRFREWSGLSINLDLSKVWRTFLTFCLFSNLLFLLNSRYTDRSSAYMSMKCSRPNFVL